MANPISPNGSPSRVSTPPLEEVIIPTEETSSESQNSTAESIAPLVDSLATSVIHSQENETPSGLELGSAGSLSNDYTDFLISGSDVPGASSSYTNYQNGRTSFQRFLDDLSSLLPSIRSRDSSNYEGSSSSYSSSSSGLVGSVAIISVRAAVSSGGFGEEEASNPIPYSRLEELQLQAIAAPTASLSLLIQELQAAVPDDSLKLFDFGALYHKEGEVQSEEERIREESIRLWISKLKWDDVSWNSEMKSVIGTEVLSLLQYAVQNPSFMAPLDAALFEATGSCDDRSKWVINHLKMQKILMEASAKSPAEYLEAFRAVFILTLLEKIARGTAEKRKDLFSVDPISIHLGYMARLKDTFNLPLSAQRVHFFGEYFGISDQDVQRAEKIVRAALREPHKFIHFLSDQPDWRKKLIKEFAEEHGAVVNGFYDAIEGLSLDMPSQDYKAACDAIEKEKNRAEEKWFVEKSMALFLESGLKIEGSSTPISSIVSNAASSVPQTGVNSQELD